MGNETQRGSLPLTQLKAAVEAGEVDTVTMAMVDMQGRLQGKRLTAQHFLNDIADAHAEGCNYQLAVDVEMNPVSGYRHASWSTGYGDFSFVPDLSSLRWMPWHEGSVFVMSDLTWEDSTPVTV